MALQLVKEWRCFAGAVRQFKHASTATKTEMTFSVYLPPQALDLTKRVPVLYWLSGLSCSDENFITKAGAQRVAALHGVALVCPDTSPRGVVLPGDRDNYDFGVAAGFYLNATQSPWSDNYRMYEYVTEELPALVNSSLHVNPASQSIFGHSMGGHGALVCALRNPGKYKSVSAFAPICNPTKCPWGVKAFTGYLGPDTESWKAYDAVELVSKYSGPDLHMLVDQGTEDQFLKSGQLLTENLQGACAAAGMPATINYQAGYDHSYFFISTFVEEHIAHHARFLNE